MKSDSGSSLRSSDATSASYNVISLTRYLNEHGNPTAHSLSSSSPLPTTHPIKQNYAASSTSTTHSLSSSSPLPNSWSIQHECVGNGTGLMLRSKPELVSLQNFLQNYEKIFHIAAIQELLLNIPDLSDDDMSNLAPAIKKVYPRIQGLSLFGCGKITDNGIELIAQNFPSLQYLNLNGCSSVSDAGVKHLAMLIHLQSLDLGVCHDITDAGIKHLETLNNLQSINLGWCKKITEKGIRHLKALNLEFLDLYGCDVSKEAKENPIAYLKNLCKKDDKKAGDAVLSGSTVTAVAESSSFSPTSLPASSSTQPSTGNNIGDSATGIGIVEVTAASSDVQTQPGTSGQLGTDSGVGHPNSLVPTAATKLATNVPTTSTLRPSDASIPGGSLKPGGATC